MPISNNEAEGSNVRTMSQFETMLQSSVAQKIVVTNHPLFALHWFNTGCASRIPFFFSKQDILKGIFLCGLLGGHKMKTSAVLPF